MRLCHAYPAVVPRLASGSATLWIQTGIWPKNNSYCGGPYYLSTSPSPQGNFPSPLFTTTAATSSFPHACKLPSPSQLYPAPHHCLWHCRSLLVLFFIITNSSQSSWMEPFSSFPPQSMWNPNLVSIFTMELYLCWMMVSSDCMIRVETSLMNELNQNKDSLVEPHLYPWQCRMLGATVSHSTEWIYKYRCVAEPPKITHFWRCLSSIRH